MAEKLHRYVQQAEQAERLARSAATQAEREAYLKIAAVWRELATTREGLMKREDG